MMKNYDELKLNEEELDKFSLFLEEHDKCSDDLTLISRYNVKLIFNIKGNSIIPTCLCSVCGAEDLIASQERYKEI